MSVIDRKSILRLSQTFFLECRNGNTTLKINIRNTFSILVHFPILQLDMFQKLQVLNVWMLAKTWRISIKIEIQIFISTLYFIAILTSDAHRISYFTFIF